MSVRHEISAPAQTDRTDAGRRGGPSPATPPSPSPGELRAGGEGDSDTRYRLLFRNMLDGFAYCRMIFDERGHPADFVYLEVNDAFGALTGLRDVVGRRATEIFPGIRESHPELLETYGRVARTGLPERFETPFQPLGISLTISVYRPEPDHFVAVFDDISGRKRAEQERETTVEFLRLVNAASTTDELVKAAASFFQRRSGCEVVGIQLKRGDHYPYWEARGSPSELVVVENDLCGETSESVDLPLAVGEEQLGLLQLNDRRKGMFSTESLALWERLAGYLAVALARFRSVERYIEAQQSLAVVTRLYAVLSRVNEAIVRTRDEVPLLEEVCRIGAEEGGFPLVWVGFVKDREVVPAASAGRAADYLHEIRVEVEGELGRGPTGTCVREGRPVINDDFRTNPSTSPWREASLKHGLRASASFPLHRGGEITGALTFYAERPGAFSAEQVKLLESLCADVSFALEAMAHERLRGQAERALRESERSLREADRRKDEFLGMLSHELRNPLAPIRNAVYILKRTDPVGDRAARARDVIERQSEHLTRLVDDLLDVTRIVRGKVEVRPSLLDLGETVQRAADDFRAMLEERGLEFRTVLPPTKVLARADGTRITQVIGNLLHNAAKFTQRGDAVILTLALADGGAEIRVRDTGAGIEPEVLPHVFDAFVQGQHTLARSEGGLGLGLALVKGIAELHGGSVRAESGGPGQGAELVVRLPLAAPADAVVEGEGHRHR